MKKRLAILTCMMCITVLFAACGGKKDTGSSQTSLKPDQSVNAIVESIVEESVVPMAAEVDDTILKDMFYIDVADVANYSGQFSQVNVSCANVIVVEAKGEGQVKTVQESLEKRKKDMENSFEMYLPDQYEIAQNAKIVTKGNYVALLMVDNPDRAEEIFNEAFES